MVCSAGETWFMSIIEPEYVMNLGLKRDLAKCHSMVQVESATV
jgi:hypothetical protein